MPIGGAAFTEECGMEVRNLLSRHYNITKTKRLPVLKRMGLINYLRVTANLSVLCKNKEKVIKMKLFRNIITIIMLTTALAFATDVTAQNRSNFSTSSYYAEAWESYDYLQSSYYDYYGNYCERRIRMVWTKHYGQRNVRIWDNYSRRWYYESGYSYYWTYRWQSYNTCY